MNNFKKVSEVLAKIVRAVLTERFLTFLTRVLIDVPMIYLLIKGFGVVEIIGIFIPWCFIFYALVICAYDYFAQKGYDLLGLNYLSDLKSQDISNKQIIKKIARWIVKRRITVFIIGNIFLLDPDVVTIILRKKEDTGLKILFWSVVYSIPIWAIIYWLGVKGYGYFTYFVK
jgi:hypothetical protein